MAMTNAMIPDDIPVSSDSVGSTLGSCVVFPAVEFSSGKVTLTVSGVTVVLSVIIDVVLDFIVLLVSETISLLVTGVDAVEEEEDVEGSVGFFVVSDVIGSVCWVVSKDLYQKIYLSLYSYIIREISVFYLRFPLQKDFRRYPRRLLSLVSALC